MLSNEQNDEGDYSFLSLKEKNNRTSSQVTMIVAMQLANKNCILI